MLFVCSPSRNVDRARARAVNRVIKNTRMRPSLAALSTLCLSFVSRLVLFFSLLALEVKNKTHNLLLFFLFSFII